MSVDLSNNIFYFLSTSAQVFAILLGFIIVGQIYIYQTKCVKKKYRTSIFVLPSAFSIYMLLFAGILFSMIGILLNIESIFGKYILVIPILVFSLVILAIKKLYSYLKILEEFNRFIKEDAKAQDD